MALHKPRDRSQLLLSVGLEWLDPAYSDGQVLVSCRRMGLDGDAAHPHVGQ